MNPLDRLFLERAYELARRATGTSPNPPVGAVVVHNEMIAGEGFHHRAGLPHAEINALNAAGEKSRGGTMYVSLEPCAHYGRTPPCAPALADAGITRVVIGTLDPNPVTGGRGARHLRERGVQVEIAHDPAAETLVEPFARAIRLRRPFTTLKMALSLDGFVSSAPGAREWLTGDLARDFVRELRIAHDAVVVGAGTVRVDNPRLTVRPPHHRLRDYVRIVACETDPVDPKSAVFAPEEGYAKTIVLAPAGARERFAALIEVADVVFAGGPDLERLDFGSAMSTLYERGIASMLCEGGPTMAAGLLAHGCVDRFHWLIAPRLLSGPYALPVLSAGSVIPKPGVRIDRVERLGADVLISGVIDV